MSTRRIATLATMIVAMTSTAHAQEETPAIVPVPVPMPMRLETPARDTLTLRDGTILRGQVTELRQGDHVEIVLLDGRPRTVPWSEIVSSEGPSFPAAPHNRAERFLRPGPGRVPVIVESAGDPLTVGVLRMRALIGQDTTTIDDGMDVQQWTTNVQSRSGVVVCGATPCRLFARPGALMLQTAGEGILASSTEVVVPPSGARVVMRAPSAAGRRGGMLLVLNSIGLVVAGGVMAGVGAAFDGSSFPGEHNNASTYYTIGGVTAGVGVGMLIAGIALLVHNRIGMESITPLADSVE